MKAVSKHPGQRLDHLAPGRLGEIQIMNRRRPAPPACDLAGQMEGRRREHRELTLEHTDESGMIGDIDRRDGDRGMAVDFRQLLPIPVGNDDAVAAGVGQHQSNGATNFPAPTTTMTFT